VTTSLPRGNITLPAVLFTIGGRTHHAGQAGGASPMRDIPRFVELLDKGQYNAKALATSVVPIERMLEAYEDVVYRTTVTAIMTCNAKCEMQNARKTPAQNARAGNVCLLPFAFE